MTWLLSFDQLDGVVIVTAAAILPSFFSGLRLMMTSYLVQRRWWMRVSPVHSPCPRTRGAVGADGVDPSREGRRRRRRGWRRREKHTERESHLWDSQSEILPTALQ